MDSRSINEMESELSKWLLDPMHAGKEPSKIEFIDSFVDEDDLECSIFKYKTGALSKWKLAIVSETGIFSRMKDYKEDSAKADSELLLHTLKDYLITLAENQRKK